MKCQLLLSKKKIRQKQHQTNGFAGMSELVVAAGVGTLLIISSGMALRSTGGLIRQSEDKTTLRQNAINGLRLMRSEVERSMHLIVNKTEDFSENQAHINLSDPRYSQLINECSTLAGNRPYQPIFGVKMSELNQPVLYGVSVGSAGYSLERCGAPLNPDGKYDETTDVFLSLVIDDIGIIPCEDNETQQAGESGSTACSNQNISKADILQTADFQFTAGMTPSRKGHEPALRIATDTNYKLVKFIDPTEASQGQDDDKITESFISKLGIGNKQVTYQPLYFTAFARADKRIDNFGEEGQGGPLNGAFFQNITSSNIRFVIDGSGSMSACVMWGDGYGSWRTFYDPNQKRYRDTRQKCALTRMEALISEMTMLLDQLPNNTKVGITAFSSSGYRNNKEWNESKDGLARLGDDENRDSAIRFVNTLDDERVTQWGGTSPWNAIEQAFEDTETDTLYLMSDGQPNKDHNGGYWSNSDHESTADYFANKNKNRQYNGINRALIVNSTSLGLESPWLEKLANKTQGYYNQIDKDSLEESTTSNS